MPEQQAWRTRRAILLIFLVGLALRLLVYAYIAHVPGKFFTFDSDEYDQRALNLLHYHVFAGEAHPPFTADLLRTPIYPLVLAVVYALAGHTISAAILAQLVLGSLTGVLTFVLATRELDLPRGAGVLAGLVVAVDPVSVMTSNQLLTETLFTLLSVTGAIALVRYWRTHALRWVILAAVVLALAALTRPIGQYLPLALLPLFPLAARRGYRRGALGAGLLFVAVSWSLIGAWAYRNYHATGVFTVSNISDTNLIYYRAREVVADARHISQDAAWTQLETSIDATVTRQHLTMARKLGLQRQEAFAIFRRYPRETVLMTLKGAGRLLADPGYSISCTLLDRHSAALHCFQGSQANMDEPGAAHMAVSGLKRMTPVQQGTLLGSALLLLAVYVCAFVGAVQLVRRRHWLALTLLLVILAYFMGVSTGGETTSRFRIAILPFLAIFAGVGGEYLQARRVVGQATTAGARLRRVTMVGDMAR